VGWLSIDRKKNMEIRPGTVSRERERESWSKTLSPFHVSFAVPTALSNTSKMNYYLEGRKGQEGSSVVK